MPCGTWVVTDVPDTNLGMVIALFKLDDARKISTMKESDGQWTVTAVFAPCGENEPQQTVTTFATLKSTVALDNWNG